MGRKNIAMYLRSSRFVVEADDSELCCIKSALTSRSQRPSTLKTSDSVCRCSGIEAILALVGGKVEVPES